MKNYSGPNAEFADSSIMPGKMLFFKLVNLKDLYLKEVACLRYNVWVRQSPSGTGTQQGQQDQLTKGAVHDED